MTGLRSVGARPARWLTAGVAFALAVIARGIKHPAVITAEGVRPFGRDAYYHLRRIHWDLIHFPRHLSFDPYLSPPGGGTSIWPPCFDWILAAIARFTVGDGDWAAAERLLVWIPPLLGGASVVVLHALAYPRFGPRRAGLAALILAFLPAHVYFSQIGFVDHHSAVSLTSVLLMLAVLSFLHRSNASTLERPAISASVLLGLVLGGALILWPGALLHVGIAETVLLCSLLGSQQGERALLRAQLLALTHFVAFALVLPFCLNTDERQWSVASPLVLSHFQPWLFATATLFFGALAIAWRRGVPASRLQRTLVATLIGSLCLALTLLLAPQSAGGVFEVFEWFSRSDSFQAVVHESRPLHTKSRAAPELLSGFLFLAPVLIASLAFWARGKPRAAEYWTIAWWSLALFAASLNQWRFVNSFAVPFALLIAWSWCGAHALVGRRFGKSPVRLRAGCHIAVTAAAIALLSPAANRFEHWLGQREAAIAGRLNPLKTEALFRVARWLRENTPVTSGYMDIAARPEYTVLSAWGDGHLLRYVSHRAPVTDNFGNDTSVTNFEAAERYFAAGSEDEALAVVAPLGVRYVVVRQSGSGHGIRYKRRAQFQTLYQRGGKALEVRSERGRVRYPIPALTRHRQIFVSQLRDQWGNPVYRIFEIVEGARVVGEALPGRTVTATLLLDGAGKDLFRYVAHGVAGASGRFELRLPYPTDRPSGRLRPTSTYKLSSGSFVALLSVAEEAVRLGKVITAPRLGVGATAPSRR